MNRFVRTLRRAGSAVRSAWLILGGVLLLWLIAELGYRGLAAARLAVVGNDVPDAHPLHDEEWFGEYRTEDYDSEVRRWKPFVYYRRHPYAGRHINVDSAGRRRTVQTVQPLSDGRLRQLWMFGGSTMWGFHQRENATIPGTVAAKLAERGITDVQITNFGEAGYVFSQELLELLVQLRGGARPDVVVFYDGLNEVPAVVQNGVAGLPQNEFSRDRDFRIGRAMFSWKYDFGTEARAAATLISLSTSRSRVVQRLQGMVAPPWPRRPVERLAGEVLESYAATVRLSEVLSDAYGYEALYLWQPTLHATGKPLSEYEKGMMGAIDADPFESDVKAIQLRVRKSLDSAMTGVAPGRFLNLSGVLDSRSEPLFTDNLGHTVERANGPIVDAFLPTLLRLLENPRAEPERARGESTTPVVR